MNREYPKKIKRLLGEILIDQGDLKQEQLQQALRLQKDNADYLGRILVEQGLVTGEQICRALASQLGLPFVNLCDLKEIDPKVIYLFPDNVVKHYKVLPLLIRDDKLIVAMADPLNLFIIQEMQQISGHKISPVLTTERELNVYLNKYFGPMRNAEVAIIEETAVNKRNGAKDVTVETMKEDAFDAPIVRLVDSIIEGAVEESASDIHIEPQESELMVRYRVDGILYDRMVIPKDMQASLISRIKIMAGIDIAERRRPQDGKIGLTCAGHLLDLRVSTLPIIHGEKVVIRLLDKSSIMHGLDRLGMDPRELGLMNSFIARPYGMILVTGPTGSGKSTTLYAALNKLNNRDKNIITVEEPIEYELKGVNQVGVNTKAGITFAKALRHIVRQDPDIIMIGEIRDLETAEIAIQSALTGHLVFSTLHTNDAPSAIVRLINMGIEPFLITSSVIGIVAQRLLRRLCNHCKKEYKAPKGVLHSLAGNAIPDNGGHILATNEGCQKCGSIGYKGRTGVFEIMNLSESIKSLILANRPLSEIRQKAIEEGMKGLAFAGLEKVLKKETSLEEAMRVLVNQE